MFPDLDEEEEEEKLLHLESQGSFDLNDEFEPKVPPLSKQTTSFKSEGVEIDLDLDFSILTPLVMKKSTK